MKMPKIEEGPQLKIFNPYWAIILSIIVGMGCAENEGITAFKNVDLVPMTEEKLIENQTVLIRGDRIIEIGPSNKIKIPKNATVIVGDGAYLMPGLADMHVHLRDDWPISQLDLYLANGVTTVRDLDGREFILKWREEIKKKIRIGPTIYVSSPAILGHEKNAPELVSQSHSQWDCIKLYSYFSKEKYLKAMQTAKRQKRYTVGHIPFAVGLDKVISAGMNEIAHIEELWYELVEFDRDVNLPPEEWLPYILKTAAEQYSADMKLEIKELAKRYAGQISKIVGKVKSAKIPVATTLSVQEISRLKTTEPEIFLARPENVYLPRSYIDAFRRGKEKHQVQGRMTGSILLYRFVFAILHELREAGVSLVIGTDAGTGGMGITPGFSIYDELRILTGNGFTPYEAIAACTKNAAKVIEAMTGKNDFGTIEVGKRADFILLHKNPLESVANIKNYRGVMTAGNWYENKYLRAIMDPALIPGIPITGIVHHTHEPDNGSKTNLEIIVGQNFTGNLPDDIDSITITVTDSNGITKTLNLPPYVYYDQHRDFWFELKGTPRLGKYTFTIASNDLIGKATEFQYINRKIPIPDVNTFTPGEGEIIIDTSPTFSWGPVEYPDTEIFYRLIIENPSRKRIFTTGRVQGMLSYTVPVGILKPGRSYPWRVRALDSDDWIEIQNRSLSKWRTFTMAGTTGVVPTSARIQNVREPDKSLHTHIDIFIGKEFSGNLPGEIDSITVTGPKGDLPFSKDDFIYFPQWRDFWISIPGPPAIGTYIFTVTSARKSGSATDTIYAVRQIPSPVTRLLSPAEEEIVNSKTPSFIWEPVEYPDVPIYYRLEIWNPSMTDRVFNTNYLIDRLSYTVPAGRLKPGQTYIWRVRVADHRDWPQVQNRTNSEWKTITMAEKLQ